MKESILNLKHGKEIRSMMFSTLMRFLIRFKNNGGLFSIEKQTIDRVESGDNPEELELAAVTIDSYLVTAWQWRKNHFLTAICIWVD